MISTYRITVVTGSVKDAGTDANVYLTLFGAYGNSGERLLDNASNNFERGHTDVFSREMADLGPIDRIRIRHDGHGDKDGWYLDRVVVHQEETDQEWVFPCFRWLAHDEDDGQIVRILDRA
jgi:hypothetical protein